MYDIGFIIPMNEVNAAIVIIALVVRRHTQIRKTQVRSKYVEELYQITVLDI